MRYLSRSVAVFVFFILQKADRGIVCLEIRILGMLCQWVLGRNVGPAYHRRWRAVRPRTMEWRRFVCCWCGLKYLNMFEFKLSRRCVCVNAVTVGCWLLCQRSI